MYGHRDNDKNFKSDTVSDEKALLLQANVSNTEVSKIGVVNIEG